MTEAVAYRDEREARAQAAELGSRFWWFFLVTGCLWLLFALILFRFDWTSVSSISILFGCVMLVAGGEEALSIFAARGWAMVGHGVLAVACFAIGAVAFANPGGTIRALAAVMSFYLVFKGIFDVIFALGFRSDLEFWWLRLLVGVVELLVGFWAAGSWDRSTTLLVAWVGIVALTRAITEIVLAFSLRSASPSSGV